MTKEQAIQTIKDLIQNGFTNFGGKEPLSAEETDALKMAIKALEQPTSEDCVSREQAVKTVLDWYFDLLEGNKTKDIVNLLDALPPVTPTFPKGATNGDMLTALFGENALITFTHNYLKDWWNAPYKRGDENG